MGAGRGMPLFVPLGPVAQFPLAGTAFTAELPGTFGSPPDLGQRPPSFSERRTPSATSQRGGVSGNNAFGGLHTMSAAAAAGGGGGGMGHMPVHGTANGWSPSSWVVGGGGSDNPLSGEAWV
jgi:hypothetical protein